MKQLLIILFLFCFVGLKSQTDYLIFAGANSCTYFEEKSLSVVNMGFQVGFQMNQKNLSVLFDAGRTTGEFALPTKHSPLNEGSISFLSVQMLAGVRFFKGRVVQPALYVGGIANRSNFNTYEYSTVRSVVASKVNIRVFDKINPYFSTAFQFGKGTTTASQSGVMRLEYGLSYTIN